MEPKHMSQTTPFTPDQPPARKHRHGCLTAYLALLIIANSATGLIYLVASESIRRNAPNLPEWALPVLIVGSIVNLVCGVALLKWKKWGFWGFAASGVVIFVVNVSAGFGVGSALVGLLGVAILYGVLHIGKETKGWSQLD